MITVFLLAGTLTVVSIGICAGRRWSRSWQNARLVVAEAERDVALWTAARSVPIPRPSVVRENVHSLTRTPSLTR